MGYPPRTGCRAIVLATVVACSALDSMGHAQITLDGTLGRSGSLSGPNFEIRAIGGGKGGVILFHCLGVFNVNSGEGAFFPGPGAIKNFLGGVTGASASRMDGLLRSKFQSA